jgi:hypothetical protein
MEKLSKIIAPGKLNGKFRKYVHVSGSLWAKVAPCRLKAEWPVV